jgi:hypothetical protein
LLQAFLQVALVAFLQLLALVAVVLAQPLAGVAVVQGMGDWNRSPVKLALVALAV